MATVKYAGEEAIRAIADYVNQKLKFVSSMPESPETDTLVLYIGSTTASYSQGGVYKYDGTNWNLINLVKTIELTQAEYDALPSAVQNNGTIYFVTDAGGASLAGKEILRGYLNPVDGKFYVESTYTTELDANVDVLYIDLNTYYLYIYDSANTEYIMVGGGGNSQIQADWNQSDNSQVDFIKNKPDLSGFITKSVNDLTNYYLKSETYTQIEVNNLIAAISTIHFEVVSSLPTTDIQTNVIYLVPKSTAQTSNVKDEYINLDGTSAGWEKIGDTEIDLSNYVTTTALNTALADYTTTASLTTLLADKANASDVGTLSNLKTTTKTDLVAAINELYDSIGTMTTEIEAALEEI